MTNFMKPQNIYHLNIWAWVLLSGGKEIDLKNNLIQLKGVLL